MSEEAENTEELEEQAPKRKKKAYCSMEGNWSLFFTRYWDFFTIYSSAQYDG